MSFKAYFSRIKVKIIKVCNKYTRKVKHCSKDGVSILFYGRILRIALDFNKNKRGDAAGFIWW